MASNVQIELWHAEKVATQTTVGLAPNGIHYGAWGETRIPRADLERLVAPCPPRMSAALATAPITLFLWPLPTPAKP